MTEYCEEIAQGRVIRYNLPSMGNRREQHTINWEKLYDATSELEPKVWEAICKCGTPVAGDAVLYSGYRIFCKGISNYPPSFGFKADLNFPETNAKPDSVDTLMRTVARLNSSEEKRLSVVPQRNYPLREDLPKDNVYGLDPVIPPNIVYTFTLERTPYRIA